MYKRYFDRFLDASLGKSTKASMNTHKKNSHLMMTVFYLFSLLPLFIFGQLDLAVYLVLFTICPFDCKDTFVAFHVPCIGRFWI